MGIIGDTFSFLVPMVNALGTQYASDVNAVLDELIARVEAKVAAASLAVPLGGNLDLGSSRVLHGTRHKVQPATVRRTVSGAGTWANSDTGAVCNTAAAVAEFDLQGLERGERLLGFVVRHSKTSGGTTTFDLRSVTSTGNVQVAPQGSSTTIGTQTSTVTLDTPVTVAADTHYLVRFSAPAPGDLVHSIHPFFDQVP